MATQSRLPTADSLLGSWSPIPAAGLYENIDDPVGTPDDAATYIFTGTPVDVVSFTFPAVSLPASSTVSKVEVIIRAKSADTTNTTKGAIRFSSSSYYYYDNGVLTVNYADYTSVWLVNPETGLAWVQADVEGTGANPLDRFGFAAWTVNSGNVLVTQAYLLVTYTVAGGATASKMALLGVG